MILDTDTLYSVTTAERFVALDFRRVHDIPNLPRIKEVEREYFQFCVSLANLGASPLDNYSTHTPPPKEINWIALGCLSLLYILPGVFYYIWKEKKHKEAIVQRANEFNLLKPRLDNLLQQNREILKIAI